MSPPEHYRIGYVDVAGVQALTVLDAEGRQLPRMAAVRAEYFAQGHGKHAPWLLVCEMVCQALNALAGLELATDTAVRAMVADPAFVSPDLPAGQGEVCDGD